MSLGGGGISVQGRVAQGWRHSRGSLRAGTRCPNWAPPPCPRQRSPKAPSVCPPVCDQEDETRFYVWLIALATLLAVGAAILLCKK